MINIDGIGKELQECSAPSFPFDALPEKMQGIVNQFHERMNLPKEFTAISMLYAIATMAGKRYSLMVNNQRSYPSLYVALVGEPGTNKTAPLNEILKPLREIDNANYKTYKEELKDYERSLSMAKKEGNSEPKEKPHCKQLLVSDITPESLSDVLQHNSVGVGVYRDELASWFKNFNRYNRGSELEFWLSLWSSQSITVNRKSGEPINVNNPVVSVIGTIQPEIVKSLFTSDNEGNGFVDRILFVAPPNLNAPIWQREQLSADGAKEAWKEICNSFYKGSCLETKELTLTTESWNLLCDWQNRLALESNESFDNETKAINAKVQLYAIRFSLILQLALWSCNESSGSYVDIKAVEGAIKLANYFKSEALKIRNQVKEPDQSEDNKAMLFESLPDQFTTSEAIEVGREMGVNERTIYRMLSKNLYSRQIAKGRYEKKKFINNQAG